MDIKKVRALVDEQANDDGLWFIAETCAEAYVQRALRRLHEAIEGKSGDEIALEILNGPTGRD